MATLSYITVKFIEDEWYIVKVKNTKDLTILLLLTYQTYLLKICSLEFYYLQFNPMSMAIS